LLSAFPPSVTLNHGLTLNKLNFKFCTIHHGSATRGPAGCIMRPTATFVNCVYTTRMTEEFRLLGTPLIAIFPREARETAHNNTCDIYHEKAADRVV